MPKNSIAAHHHAKAGEQPARSFASSAVAHHRQDIGDGIALMRVRRGETGSRSAKIERSQSGASQRHILTRSRMTTGTPCIGRSRKLR